MWTASASLNSSGPSSETNRIRMPKARAVKSSGTRSQSHLSTASHEQSRMSWRQPCYCLTCLNLLTPRRGAFRDEVQTLLQVAPAQQAESSASRHRGRPWRNVSSQPGTRGRCQFIKDHPLEEGKPRPSKSTSSRINGDMTLDTTSMSIATARMGMQRSAATVPTTVDDTTAMRTEWLQNHRALESSAEQSVACRCPARFDPSPASPNTMAKPSQSYGWQTSGWHASWEVPKETIEPSSANYRSFSPTPLADGSRSS